MSYPKTSWVDDTTPLSATNLNKIEQGIADTLTDETAALFGLGTDATPDEVFQEINKYLTYTENMTTFFAIPGASGKIRLKIVRPTNAPGVMLRYKATAWAAGDTKATGTLIADVTTDYSGANQWYEVSGLSDGTVYYIKAFPHMGSSYNEEIGANETVCTAGGLHAEYTMDSVSGATVNDTSGNAYNGTNTNTTFDGGTIGNKGNFTTSAKIAIPNAANPSTDEITYACFLSHNTTEAYRLITYFGNGKASYFAISSGNLALASNGWYVSTIAIPTNTVYCIIFKQNRSTGNCIIRVRKSGDANWTEASGTVTVRTLTDVNNIADASTFAGTQDQIRIFNRYTTSAEDDNLFNGGAGC